MKTRIKYTVFILIAFLTLLCSSLYSQEIRREGNNFTETKTVYTKSDTVRTVYTYTVGNISFPIFINRNSGRCFILRKSEKTGNKYREYLDKRICIAICDEMGIEYKTKQ